MNASGSAKSRMERVLRLQEEIDQIKGDIREIYAEEKADGGDKTAMGAAISYIRKRAKDKNAFDEREALASVYINAFEASGTAFATHTHAGEASPLYAEVKARAVTTPKASNFKASSAETVDLGTTPHDPSTGEITEHEQPETEPCDCSEHVRVGEYYHCPKCDAEWYPEGQEQPETANEMDRATEGSFETGSEAAEKGREAIPAGPEGADLSHAGVDESSTADDRSVEATVEQRSSVPIPHSAETSPAADKPETAVTPLPAVSGAIPEGIPAFLLKERKPLRPNCLHPDNCAGYGTHTCHSCTRAMAESEAA